jgi:hypothetical protein
MPYPVHLICPDSAQETLESPMITKNQAEEYKALMVDTAMISSSFTAEYATEQTDVDIITPPSGYKICVREIFVHTNGNVGTLNLDFATSNIIIDRVYFSVQSKNDTAGGHIAGAIDEPLTLNIAGTGTNKVFVRVNYVVHK